MASSYLKYHGVDSALIGPGWWGGLQLNLMRGHIGVESLS
jgi:hypothetical protein